MVIFKLNFFLTYFMNNDPYAPEGAIILFIIH